MAVVTDLEIGIENRLIEKLDLMVDRCARDQVEKDALLINEGCLAGDSLIQLSRGKNSRKYRIDVLAKNFEGINPKWNLNIPSYVRSFNGKEIRLHRIKKVFYSGVKKVFLMKLEDGKSIKATSNHRFLTRKGWMSLEKLKDNQEVLVDNLHPKKNGRIKIKLYDILLRVNYHPYALKNKRVEVHRLIYEARLNNLHLTQFLDILLNEPETSKTLKFIDPSKYHIHHKDGCHYNNSVENLQKLSIYEHLKHHGNNAYSYFSQGIPNFVKIKSITSLGEEKVYDIQCEDPHHNFVANGIVVHNSEGEGKTNTSTIEAYYAKYQFKNKYKQDRDIHLFFRLKSMINFAKTTEKKIIIWDEPSLDALKKDAMSQMNRQLERLLMTCRKKRHFFVVNLTKFYKFSEYIVVDRCLGLIHMYSRREIDPGRFVYIKKKNLETLYQSYTSKKKRLYRELKSFNGDFPEVMKKYFDKMNINVEGIPNCTYEMYNKLKDKAIESIGEEEVKSKRESESERKLNELRYNFVKIIDHYGLKKEDVAAMLQIRSARLREWRKLHLNSAISLRKEDFEGSTPTNIISIGGSNQKFSDDGSEDN